MFSSLPAPPLLLKGLPADASKRLDRIIDVERNQLKEDLGIPILNELCLPKGASRSSGASGAFIV